MNKVKGQKDKQRSTKLTHKIKYREVDLQIRSSITCLLPYQLVVLLKYVWLLYIYILNMYMLVDDG